VQPEERSLKSAAVKTIDLLIPCHNEEESAPALLQALNNTIEGFILYEQGKVQFHLIIVDDGSSDNTCQVFERLIQQSSSLAGDPSSASAATSAKKLACWLASGIAREMLASFSTLTFRTHRA